MAARTILATLAGSAPRERLQVSLGQGPERSLSIELREQHYAEGIGWFDQRTLELDSRQWRQLQEVLGLKAVNRAIEADEAEMPATLPFPGPQTISPKRPAVGEGS